MVIFYLPFLYYGATKSPNIDWWPILGFYLFGTISFPVIYFIFGKEVFQKRALWKEDGYSGFWEWIKYSKSFTARVFWWSNIFVVVSIISILVAIVITLLR